ncbi:SDR family oxidoreductase [Flavitalea sp.]|nr:SDR family NAD(P)-dependent oxidoreductase [Flavitalea sp.]
MIISNKTILITGGGSGIGLETAKLFAAKDNRVIIIGRNAETLQKAAAGLKNINWFQADITNAEDVEKLVNKLKTDFSDLSIVVNNAAAAYAYWHAEEANAFEKASEEISTNYLSVIRLNEKLLPVLKQQPEAAIVNVSSIVAFAPDAFIPTYSDTKAALHSYTLALRFTLSRDTKVKVFELMPPLVKTHFSKGIGGLENGMPAADVAQALVDGIENDLYEIHVAGTRDFRDLYLSNPTAAFDLLNQN